MPEAAEMEERSARDRRFSAKSSPPCWPPAGIRGRLVSARFSRTVTCSVSSYEEDKPRPCFFDAVGGVVLLLPPLAFIETEGLGLPLPVPLPLPVLTSRRARAPKLRRRAKGVAGTLELGASPSSNGLSSTEPEFALERLSVRGRAGVKGEFWFGEPERPTVVSERRRRWAWAAASVMGPG